MSSKHGTTKKKSVSKELAIRLYRHLSILLVKDLVERGSQTRLDHDRSNYQISDRNLKQLHRIIHSLIISRDSINPCSISLGISNKPESFETVLRGFTFRDDSIILPVFLVDAG